MKFEHVDFNETFWKGKTVEEFIEHENHHGLSENKLREAWGLMNAEATETATATEESPALNAGEEAKAIQAPAATEVTETVKAKEKKDK